MSEPEFWLRGPRDGVPDLLQPIAHALLQANQEISVALINFPDDKLWEKPCDMASVAFHLQHIPGVLDRLFTYADGHALTHSQLKYLSEEGLENEQVNTRSLLNDLHERILSSIEKLKTTDAPALLEFRGVGRNQLPSTVLGILFHAAEHTMRHTGQLLVTAKIVNHE